MKVGYIYKDELVERLKYVFPSIIEQKIRMIADDIVGNKRNNASLLHRRSDNNSRVIVESWDSEYSYPNEYLKPKCYGYIYEVDPNETSKKCENCIYREGCIVTDENRVPKIESVTYSNKVDSFDYSCFICHMSNGEDKVFHYCIKNPIPKEYVIKGQTWQWLIGFMNGMWRETIGEHKEINYVKIDKN